MDKRYRSTAHAALVGIVMVLPALGCAQEGATGAAEAGRHIERLDALAPQRLGEIAKGNDTQEAGYAEWVLALRSVHADGERSRLHIARAALLLGTSQPILDYGRSFLFDDDQREQALPLLLLARELGGEWADARLAAYGAEQKERGARALLDLKEEIRRLEEEP